MSYLVAQADAIRLGAWAFFFVALVVAAGCIPTFIVDGSGESVERGLLAIKRCLLVAAVALVFLSVFPASDAWKQMAEPVKCEATP